MVYCTEYTLSLYRLQSYQVLNHQESNQEVYESSKKVVEN